MGAHLALRSCRFGASIGSMESSRLSVALMLFALGIGLGLAVLY